MLPSLLLLAVFTACGSGDSSDDFSNGGACTLLGDWACQGTANDHLTVWQEGDAYYLDFSICDDPIELSGDPSVSLDIVTETCALQQLEVRDIEGTLALGDCGTLLLEADYYAIIGSEHKDFYSDLTCTSD